MTVKLLWVPLLWRCLRYHKKKTGFEVKEWDSGLVLPLHKLYSFYEISHIAHFRADIQLVCFSSSVPVFKIFKYLPSWWYMAAAPSSLDVLLETFSPLLLSTVTKGLRPCWEPCESSPPNPCLVVCQKTCLCPAEDSCRVSQPTSQSLQE